MGCVIIGIGAAMMVVGYMIFRREVEPAQSRGEKAISVAAVWALCGVGPCFLIGGAMPFLFLAVTNGFVEVGFGLFGAFIFGVGAVMAIAGVSLFRRCRGGEQPERRRSLDRKAAIRLCTVGPGLVLCSFFPLALLALSYVLR